MITRSRVQKSRIEKSLRDLSTLLIGPPPAYDAVFACMGEVRSAFAALGADTAPEGWNPPAAVETIRLLTGMDAYAICLHQPMRDIAVGRALAALAQLREFRHAR